MNLSFCGLSNGDNALGSTIAKAHRINTERGK